MTTTVHLKSCPRCTGALSVSSDIYGAYWRCAQCGFHTETDVPQPARIRRSEAMKAYHTFFEYVGPQKTFQGYRLRGRLLPRGQNISTESFDLLCPYPSCGRHQKRYGRNARIYRCKNGHPVNLDLTEQTWS